jgi:prepilin-type processing-associated H-X9-DG protein
LSFVYPLLPYIEQTAIYDNIKGRLDSNGSCDWIWYGGANTPSVAPVSIFACPSDTSAVVPQGQLQRINYRLNWGDIVSNCDSNTVRSPFRHGNTETSNFGTLTDGTSNTIALAEAPVTTEYGPNPGVKRGVAELGIDGDGSTVAGLCLAKKKADGTVDSSITGNSSRPDLFLGRRVYDGLMPATGVNFILQPNSPFCGYASAPLNATYSGFYGTGSFHTGGVNVVLCDGSVRFVSDTVDAGDPNQNPRTATGISSGNLWASSFASIYGVWGAAATPGSGESKQLP